MPTAPTFSSFPERPKPAAKSDSAWEQGGLQASTSASNTAATATFSSFPERYSSRNYNLGEDRRREEDRHRKSRQTSPETLSKRKRPKSDRHEDEQERRSHKGHRERREKHGEDSEKRDRFRSYKEEQDEGEPSRKYQAYAEAADTTKKSKENRSQEPVTKVCAA